MVNGEPPSTAIRQGQLHPLSHAGIWGHPQEDTIGFGDSDNDLQMTQAAGSVCMGNGSSGWKQLCDRIAPTACTRTALVREFAALGPG